MLISSKVYNETVPIWRLIFSQIKKLSIISINIAQLLHPWTFIYSTNTSPAPPLQKTFYILWISLMGIKLGSRETIDSSIGNNHRHDTDDGVQGHRGTASNEAHYQTRQWTFLLAMKLSMKWKANLSGAGYHSQLGDLPYKMRSPYVKDFQK